MACLRLVIFFPALPLRRVPRLRSCMAFPTFLEAALEYFLAIFSSSQFIWLAPMGLLKRFPWNFVPGKQVMGKAPILPIAGGRKNSNGLVAEWAIDRNLAKSQIPSAAGI